MKRATIWVCDICGKEVEGRSYQTPANWGTYDIYKFLDLDISGDFCSIRCAQKAVEDMLKAVNELVKT